MTVAILLAAIDILKSAGWFETYAEEGPQPEPIAVDIEAVPDDFLGERYRVYVQFEEPFKLK